MAPSWPPRPAALPTPRFVLLKFTWSDMKTFARFLECLAACAVLSWTAAAAQETVNSASVAGRVADQQGGVIPGAAVSARQTDTNVTDETTTDQEGSFRFPY